MVHFNTRNPFFTLSVTEHWNRFPREVEESPSLVWFSFHLDIVWTRAFRWLCLGSLMGSFPTSTSGCKPSMGGQALLWVSLGATTVSQWLTINTGSHPVQHLHTWSGWCGCKHYYLICWWHQAGWCVQNITCWAILQKDLHRLKERANKNTMKLNKIRVESCTREWAIKNPEWAEICCGWKQPCWKDCRVHGRQQQKSVGCHCSNKGKSDPQLHLQGQGDTWRRVNQWIQVAAGEVFSRHKKEILHSESNHSLEQPSQRCGGVPINGGF